MPPAMEGRKKHLSNQIRAVWELASFTALFVRISLESNAMNRIVTAVTGPIGRGVSTTANALKANDFKLLKN